MPMNQKFATSPVQYRGDLVDVQTGFNQCNKFFAAECILPNVRTDTCDFVYHQFDLESGMVQINADVIDKSRVHEAPNLEATLVAGKLIDLALDVPITWCTKQAAASACSGIPEDLEVQELIRLTSLVKLQREIKTLEIVLDTTKYTNNTGGSGNAVDAMAGNLVNLATINGGSHQLNQPTGAYDPLILLTSLIGTSPFPVTHMATNRRIMGFLRTHPAFIANGALNVTETNAQLAASLGLMGICEGQTFSSVGGVRTALFGNYILLFSKSDASTVDCKVPSFGFTAKMPENGNLDEMYVAQYESWAHGMKGTTFLRTGESIKPIVLNYGLAILISNVLV